MKNLKMLYIALIALVTGAFGACTSEFEPGAKVSGPQVSFMPNNTTKVEFTGNSNENSQKLVLSRIDTTEELDVFLLVEMETRNQRLFNIPEVVTFAAGEATAELAYTVHQDGMEQGEEYTVNFLIADEMITTPYGYAEWKVSYSLNPWVLVQDAAGNNAKGKARLGDLFSGYFDIDPTPEIDVNIYQHKTNEGVYKMEDPWGLTTALSFGYSTLAEAISKGLGYVPTDLIFNCANPKVCYIPQQPIGIDVGYGEFKIWSDYDPVKYPDGVPGVLEDGVLTFPEGSIYVAMAKYNNGQFVPANAYGMFRIVFPGVEIVDYSLAVAYDGMDVAADNKTTTAKFKFSYGDDVTAIKYLLKEGNIENNPVEALSALFVGEDENILEVENFVKGGKSANIRLGLERGIYTIVAAPADKNGKLRSKEAIVKSFYFAGMGDTEEHPCELEVLTAKMSEMEAIFGAEVVAANPDYASLAYCLLGKELRKCVFLVAKASSINQLTAAGATLEEVVTQYGTDLPAQYLELVNSDEGLASFSGPSLGATLDPETEYVVAAYAENNYGESKLVAKSHTTDAIPYSGNLVLGNYYMSCTMGVGTEDETKFENYFHLSPIPDTENQFLVKNFAIEDGLRWYATYDETASTMTLNGLTVGNESLGSLFGQVYGKYDTAGNYYYGIFSYGNAEATTGKDPVVLKVDPTTKQLCGLPTGAEVYVAVFGASSQDWEWSHNAFDDTTTITHYSAQSGSDDENGGASTASIMSVNTPSVYTLARSIEKASMTSIIANGKSSKQLQMARLTGVTNRVVKPTIKTVKPSLVESYTPVKSQGFKLKANIEAVAR